MRPRLAFRIRDGAHFPCWRLTSLGCIIEPYSEKVYGEHDYEVLTSSREGLQRQEDHFGSKQRHDTDGYNIIPFGYCTYRNRSDDGKFAFNINTISEKAIVSKFYPVFRFTNANSTFMAEFLNSSPRVKKKLSVLAVGTSQEVLSLAALKAAKIKLAQTEETLATAKENLEAAKQQHTKTSAAVSIAKTIYESFLPKEAEAKEPDNGTVQATNTVKTSADKSSDKAQNETLKAGTVKTGDTANAGAYGIALTGSILALGAALKKRRPSKYSYIVVLLLKGPGV